MLWLKAFLLTQLFEMPIYAIAARARSWPKRLLIAFVASAITHPVVWATTGRLMQHLGFWGAVAATESFAVVAETLYLSACKIERAWVWALLANAVSFGFGLLISELTTVL